MRVRAITALFFVIVMVAAMLLGSYVFIVFFTLLSGYCLNEFYGIIGDDSGKPNKRLGVLLGISGFSLFAGCTIAGLDSRYLLLPVLLVAAAFIIPLYQRDEKPFVGIAYTLLGVVYVVLP